MSADNDKARFIINFHVINEIIITCICCNIKICCA